MTKATKSKKEGSATVRQTIVTNLEAPRLEGVSTKDFTTFLRRRELYEKQIHEKNNEPGVNVTPTSYKACIDDSHLKIFLTAKWVEAETLEAITEEMLKECVKARSSHEPQGYELGKIDNIVRDVKMNMKMDDAEDRVWTLHHTYITVLEAAGMTDLPEKKPHIAIGHILKRVEPKLLRRRMKDILIWRKDEGFEKKDFGEFMRELAKQAKRLEEELVAASRRSDSDSDSDDSATARRTSKHRNHRRKNGNKNGSGGSTKTNANTKDKSDGQHTDKKRPRDPPKCLNKDCNERHFIADCENTPDEEKKRLVEEYRSKRKRREGRQGPKNEGVKRLSALADKAVRSNTSLFSAALADGAVECVVLADQGSDANVMSNTTLQQLIAAAPSTTVENITPERVYKSVTDGELICNKSVHTDVRLRIRHGSSLLVRGMVWEVSKANIPYLILGRHTLSQIGCDNEAMLAAVCDRNDGVVTLNGEDEDARTCAEKHGRVAALQAEMFETLHSSGGDEYDAVDDESLYIDLGEDDDGEVEAALDAAAEHARQQGMSRSGSTNLRKLLGKYRSIFD